MKPKTIIPLVIGLGVGFFAIKMGVDMVKKAKGSQEQTYAVVFSGKSIEAAQRITEKMVQTRKVPKSFIPSNGFFEPEAIVGRVTKVPVPAGVPITQAMLAPKGAEPGLAATIPPGFRAVSVKVTEDSAVAGFVLPGSRVDVSTVEKDGSGKSHLILQNVEVGAVGQSMSQIGPDGKSANISKSVTLFLRPEQVSSLNSALAKSRGNIRLAMRGHNSDPGESAMGSWLSNLFKKNEIENESEPEQPEPKVIAPEPVQVAVQKPTFHVVEVRRGDDVKRLVFDNHGGVREFPGDQPLPPQFGGPAWAGADQASSSGRDEINPYEKESLE